MSSEVVFQGSPKTIRSPKFSSDEEIFVILDSGSLNALGDSSIFRFVVLSMKQCCKIKKFPGQLYEK